MEDFKDLGVWDKAHQLTLAVYKLHRHFRKRRVWIDESGATSVRFDRGEYRGRMWKPIRWGDEEISSDCHAVRRVNWNAICCSRRI